MKSRIATVKGTRDFYPEEMQLRTWLYETMRRVATSFGYQEYEAPLLEPRALYAAKAGAALVQEQAFVFADRGGELITLRPELTPSLARMVAQRPHLSFPLRWWSFGPMWRYERPQKGRSREFFQWNVDLIGGQPQKSPSTEPEPRGGGVRRREAGPVRGLDRRDSRGQGCPGANRQREERKG
jgi:histidyl-tRNA synthetase